MAYAIIEAGGKQFKVAEGQVIQVPLIAAEVGSSVEFDVLLHGDGDTAVVGADRAAGARVTAKVIEHGRDPKVIVFKKKRRKGYKKIHGHRQDFTAVYIESLGEEKQISAEKTD